MMPAPHVDPTGQQAPILVARSGTISPAVTRPPGAAACGAVSALPPEIAGRPDFHRKPEAGVSNGSQDERAAVTRQAGAGWRAGSRAAERPAYAIRQSAGRSSRFSGEGRASDRPLIPSRGRTSLNFIARLSTANRVSQTGHWQGTRDECAPTRHDFTTTSRARAG